MVLVNLYIVLAVTSLQVMAQISFQNINDKIFLRYGEENIIELTGADKVDLEVGETVNFFSTFIIVREADKSWKPGGFFSPLRKLALSSDGTTVEVKDFTQPPIFGPGVLYGNRQDEVAFFTTDTGLSNRIENALNGDPGDIPTPPPDQGEWGAWSSWSACSATCDTGFRSRQRECTGCSASCCVCPPGETFQIDECLDDFCDGEWGSWSPFSSCSRTCGGGFRARTRVCEGNGPCHLGESFEHETCNIQDCCT